MWLFKVHPKYCKILFSRVNFMPVDCNRYNKNQATLEAVLKPLGIIKYIFCSTLNISNPPSNPTHRKVRNKWTLPKAILTNSKQEKETRSNLNWKFELNLFLSLCSLLSGLWHQQFGNKKCQKPRPNQIGKVFSWKAFRLKKMNGNYSRQSFGRAFAWDSNPLKF